jgi:hypothetical protein
MAAPAQVVGYVHRAVGTENDIGRSSPDCTALLAACAPAVGKSHTCTSTPFSITIRCTLQSREFAMLSVFHSRGRARAAGQPRPPQWGK